MYKKLKADTFIEDETIVAKIYTAKKFNRVYDNIKILNKLIKKCTEKNIKVFLLTPTACKYYIKSLNNYQLLRILY